MGLCIDVFANTPGVAAASMTFIGLLQPYLFELFVPRDSADDLEAVHAHHRCRFVCSLHVGYRTRL